MIVLILFLLKVVAKHVRDLDLLLWYYYRSAFVLHEEHDEFRRFGLAGVPSNDVNIIRAFIESLTRRESHFFSTSHLHHDGAFQNINESMRIVTVDWVRTARRILNGDHQTLLTGKVCQVFRKERRHFCLSWRFLGV